MPAEVQTCPKCGAMITPNLSRCRQCGTFLHGVKLEGALFDGLLPEAFASSPGTGLMVIALFLYYALMVMFAGPDAALGLSPYALRQLGAVFSPAIIEGEYWRFATGMLGHAGIGHLIFNLYALTIVGPLVEDVYDRKKMLVIFIVGGILAMVASYVWSTEIRGQLLHTTIGASGGTSALIGACLIGARRRGSGGRDIAQVMTRWTAYMVLFGLAVQGIDNAAHIGGWLVGAGLAAIFPLGVNPTVTVNRVYSLVVLMLLGGLLASVIMMLTGLQGYGARLEADAYPRRFLFFTYAEGKTWDYSSQVLLSQRCQKTWSESLRDAGQVSEAIDICERAVRAHPHPQTYRALVDLHLRAGDRAAAEKRERVLARWPRRR